MFHTFGKRAGTNREDRHSPCETMIAGGVTSQIVTVQPDIGVRWQERIDQSRRWKARSCAKRGPAAWRWCRSTRRCTIAEAAADAPRSRASSTQLIATAEQVPQTRSLRRATPADAQTAYGHSAAPRSAAAWSRRTRRVDLKSSQRGCVVGDGGSCRPAAAPARATCRLRASSRLGMVDAARIRQPSGRWHRRGCRRRSSRTGRRRHGLGMRLGRRLLGLPRAPGGRQQRAPPPFRAAPARRCRRGNPPAPAAPAGNRSRCRISATAGIRPPPHRTRSATADGPSDISSPGRAPLMISSSSNSDAEREQHVAQRHRPFGARHQRQLHPNGRGERHVRASGRR